MKIVPKNLKKKENPTGSDYSQLKSNLLVTINAVNNDNNNNNNPERLLPD